MALMAVVLAAGQGTRMRSDLPKVAHRAAGRPLIEWVVGALENLSPERTVVVLGPESDAVSRLLPAWCEVAIQDPPRGTGDAAVVGVAALGEVAGDDTILVSYGDMPLLTGELLRSVVDARESGAAVALATAYMWDPTGYGRIVRDESGAVERIVEEKDATAQIREIDEVNAGVYAFAAADLALTLAGLGTDNAQGEYYLTDVVGALAAEGRLLRAVEVPGDEVMGVNSFDQLAEAEAELHGRIALAWMRSGVRLQDPSRVYIDAEVTLEPGAVLRPGVHLEGQTSIAAGAEVGPDSLLIDTTVGPGARVWYSVLRGANVGEGAEVGPYASLRPGTVIESGAKAGTFVEIKNSQVGPGAKVPHLAYIGDAEIGSGANVGAGTITCNYDGYEKHRTVVGDGAFIGSDTMLVAPVTIGENAVTGAGSVITRDVEAGALAVERSVQENIPGYAARRAQKQQKRQD